MRTDQEYMEAVESARMMLHQMRPILGRYGLPASVDAPYVIFLSARIGDRLTQSFLKAACGSENLTYLLRRLVDAGVFECDTGSHDKRTKSLTLTAKGQTIAREMSAALATVRSARAA